MESFSGQEEAEFGCVASCNKTYRIQFPRVFHCHVLWAKQRAHDKATKHWEELSYSQETENASSLLWGWTVPHHLVWPSKPLLTLLIPKTPSLAPPIFSFLSQRTKIRDSSSSSAQVPREALCGQQLPQPGVPGKSHRHWLLNTGLPFTKAKPFLCKFFSICWNGSGSWQHQQVLISFIIIIWGVHQVLPVHWPRTAFNSRPRCQPLPELCTA